MHYEWNGTLACVADGPDTGLVQSMSGILVLKIYASMSEPISSRSFGTKRSGGRSTIGVLVVRFS